MVKRASRLKSPQQKRYERAQRKARYGRSWDEIRKLVYQRDGYRCRSCGRHRDEVRKLNAHHILLLRVSKTNSDRNLITLCDQCHRIIENKALALLKAGGHKRDVVRMTYRYLVEQKAKRNEPRNKSPERNIEESTEYDSRRVQRIVR